MVFGDEARQPPEGRVLWEGYVKDQDEAIRVLEKRVVDPSARVWRSRLRNRGMAGAPGCAKGTEVQLDADMNTTVW